MATRHTIQRHFNNVRGLDLRSSDLVQNPATATDLLNVAYRKTGALNKRRGYQSKTETAGGYGLGIFADLNTSTGAITERIVSVGANLNLLSEKSFTITYSGGGSARVSIFLDDTTATFKCQIIEDGTTVLDLDMGYAIEEASFTTVSSLKTAIDAVTNFSASFTGAGTGPAAFIDITRELDLSAGSGSIPFYEWETVNSPLASQFANTDAAAQDSDFINASMVNHSNVLYIATGRDELMKYDGQTCYRAGLPQGGAVSIALAGGGAITDTSIKYAIHYTQKDAKGNFTQGILSDESSALSPSSQQIDVTVDNIQASSGFNTNCAVVAGTQSGVTTITVDDGAAGTHTMQVGDTAYFYDGVEGDYVEREVTAVNSSSITIAGAAVDVTDNDVISNNLRISIYRTTASGSTHYLVADIPNNSFSATQVYTDNDNTIGAEYVVPVKPKGLPPKAAYITAFQNRLFLAGDPDNVNTVYYSDVLSAEAFPAGDNSFLVDNEKGDKVTGIAPNHKVLFVFKDRSIYSVDGDIERGQFAVREVSGGDVGCSSHHSIKQVKGMLMFLGQKGVFAIDPNSSPPEEISDIIEPEFTDFDVEFDFSQAVAVNDTFTDKYLLYMPVKSTSGSKLTAGTNSRVFVYDYYRKAWTKWDNINAMGGMVLKDKELWFQEKRLGTLATTDRHHIYRISNTGDTWDYADHHEGIAFTYKTHWENGGTVDEMGRFSAGSPTVPKKFLRLKVHSLDGSANDFESSSFTLDIKTEIDYISNTSSELTLDFGSEGSNGWGADEWGKFPWGSSRLLAAKSKLKSVKAKSIRTIFTNSAIHENILISGYEYEVAGPYKNIIKE